MAFADNYLTKQSLHKGLIEENPAEDLKYIVIIPSYNESGLIKSLDSLFNALPPNNSIEVIVNINWPENAAIELINESISLYKESVEWAKQFSTDKKKFYIIKSPSLNKKHAGVGLARKIAMDEAIFRFNLLDNPDGIICSFDADALCAADYFQKLDSHYINNPSTDGCSIYYEHPTSGEEFPDSIYQGIIQYELHLRYYLQAFRFSGHPHCFHTVGSSFSVRANAYCREGGMNKKKAGEDFYFLQKIFDLGNFTECNTTAVMPSPRPSDRVPFGTGKVISEYALNEKELLTYNLKLFLELKEFIEYVLNSKVLGDQFKDDLYKSIPFALSEYFKTIDFEAIIDEIILNSSGGKSLKKRFFRWFNMFRIMKFLNFGKNIYPDVPVSKATIDLLSLKGVNVSDTSALELLEIFRALERE